MIITAPIHLVSTLQKINEGSFNIDEYEWIDISESRPETSGIFLVRGSPHTFTTSAYPEDDMTPYAIAFYQTNKETSNWTMLNDDGTLGEMIQPKDWAKLA